MLPSYELPVSRTIPQCSNCTERGSFQLDIPWQADLHGGSAGVCRETMEEEWMEWGLGEQEVTGRNWEEEKEEKLG